jgi:hypothetical protein
MSTELVVMLPMMKPTQRNYIIRLTVIWVVKLNVGEETLVHGADKNFTSKLFTSRFSYSPFTCAPKICGPFLYFILVETRLTPRAHSISGWLSLWKTGSWFFFLTTKAHLCSGYDFHAR